MKKQPNIIFILTDDQGEWALGCSGNPDIQTPNIDKLAQNGMRFDHFFCASPVCSPARASLVTGEMPSAHGVHDWLCRGNVNSADHTYMKHFSQPEPDTAIDYLAGHDSYVAELAKGGYQCALSGKWHLGDNVTPKQGFSKWFTIAGGGCPYFASDICEDGKFHLETRYVTEVITDKALDYLDEYATSDAPFYMSVHYTAPHSPWDAGNHPQELRDLYADSDFAYTPLTTVHDDQIFTCSIGEDEKSWREHLTGYYAAITGVDNGVGALVAKLQEIGKLEDTIIVYTADNGMNLGQHGIWGKGNGTFPPNMYDTSVKVPLIISNPSFVSGVSHDVLSACDIFPTLLSFASIPHTPSEKQCGTSFAPLLEGKPLEREQDIFICDEYGIVRMMRTETRKLVICSDDHSKDQFFDLEKDPKETQNELENPAYASEVSQMKEALQAWFIRYSHPAISGEHLPVTGRGQKLRCTEKNAFVQDVRFYYPEKHPNGTGFSNS